MPTKPTIGIPFVFASDANYTTGPVPLQGTPTKTALTNPALLEGWKADQKPPAQNFNDLLNKITQLTNWVNEGSFDPDEDAHVVETNDDGRIHTAAVRIGGVPGSTVVPLRVLDNAAATVNMVEFDSSGNDLTGATLDIIGGLDSTTLHIANNGTGIGLDIDSTPTGLPLQLAVENIASRGHIKFVGATIDPFNVTDGELWMRRDTPHRGGLTYRDARGIKGGGLTSGNLKYWSSPLGSTEDYVADEIASTSPSLSATEEVLLTLNYDDSDPLSASGEHRLYYNVEVVESSAATNCEVRVNQDSGTLEIFKTSLIFSASIVDQAITVSGWIPVTPNGTQDYQLTIRQTNGSGAVVVIDRVRLWMRGVYETGKASD